MCWEYIDIIASNIPKWKSKQLVSELLDSTYRGSLKNVGVYLEISLLDCLTTKNFQNFSKISAKFQDFPGLFKFKAILGLVGTMQSNCQQKRLLSLTIKAVYKHIQSEIKFWDFLTVEQIFLLPQLKQSVIIIIELVYASYHTSYYTT